VTIKGDAVTALWFSEKLFVKFDGANQKTLPYQDDVIFDV